MRILFKLAADKWEWIDVRHTWASWHVQAGTPLNRLMELGAGRSMNTFSGMSTLRPTIWQNTPRWSQFGHNRTQETCKPLRRKALGKPYFARDMRNMAGVDPI
jgi:hypothetical protein